jgi:proline dehydrogenase
MALMRNVFLAASQSSWLRERAPRYRFVRRTVARFMPGETIDDALTAVRDMQKQNIGSVLTHLGENITDPAEAEQVTQHYLDVLDKFRETALPAEVSVKLTHLGLDLGAELCYRNLARIIERASERDTARSSPDVVWIDMEGTDYTDATLDIFRRARSQYRNVGICLQAYLYRTAADLDALLPLGPAVRLVKGAYKEPPDRAFPRKKDVDENFFTLTTRLLSDEAQRAGVRAAIATHDVPLIRRIIAYADSRGLAKTSYEFQMLYGIQRDEQLRLAREGFRSIVLIAYGEYWFAWFMRRMAERPANAWFALRNIVAG